MRAQGTFPPAFEEVSHRPGLTSRGALGDSFFLYILKKKRRGPGREGEKVNESRKQVSSKKVWGKK